MSPSQVVAGQPVRRTAVVAGKVLELRRTGMREAGRPAVPDWPMAGMVGRVGRARRVLGVPALFLAAAVAVGFAVELERKQAGMARTVDSSSPIRAPSIKARAIPA